MIITHRQCIAARELLGWKREELEKKAEISRSTLADFERGARNLRMDSLERILGAFEKAGIKFENDDVKYRIDLLKDKNKKDDK